MKPGVIISFDVECSMGGAWQNNDLKPVSPEKGMMGKYGDKYFGIPLICEILEKNNLSATFFLEPFNSDLGYSGQTEKVCSYLMEKKQDIQLHVHPNHYHYGLHLKGEDFSFTDQMGDLPKDKQIFLLNEGAQRIEKYTGVRPRAFRAGNMGASQTTLEALSEAGFLMDSSYTFPFSGSQCMLSFNEDFNGSKWFGNVLETALSGFVSPYCRNGKPLDLMGISFEESVDAVSKICASGADAVLILHSFSLFKVKDKQYNGGKINRIVKNRFEKFCKWLSQNRDKYPCRTFMELGDLVQSGKYNPSSAAPCTVNKPFTAFVRKGVQFANNFYQF